MHIFEFNINFKDSVKAILLNKSEILAKQEVVISCFNYSTTISPRADSVSKSILEFMFNKITKI